MEKKLKRWAFYTNVLKKPLRIMRWSLFLILLGVIQAQAISGYAQKNVFTLSYSNFSVAEVLNEIEKKSDFYFMCNRALVDLDRKVNIQVENQSVESILEKLFEDTNVKFVITGRQIVLSPSKNTSVQQQKKSVSGKVTDSSGTSLPGVSVVIKGTTNGTISDANGNYSLSNVPENAILQFSFVGMKTQEVAIAGKTTINVVMEEDAIGIEEVVAVGYGSVKKSDLTGAVASVTSEELKETVNGSIQEALQGRTAGVQILSGEGTPGGDISIRVRGGTSISASNEPLYVIDGFPIIVDRGEINYGPDQDASATSNALNGLDPNDIESIEILKDASATAIYGSRGANGVIIITTKTGELGNPKLTFDSFYSSQKITGKLNVLNANQYAEYRLAGQTDPNSGTSLFMNDFLDNPGKYESTDWQDEIYQTGQIQSYNLGVNGGTKAFRYNISLGTFSNDGIIMGSSFDRYNIRGNFSGRLSEKLEFSAILASSYSNQVGVPTGGSNGGRAGVVTSSASFPPIRVQNDEIVSELSQGENYNPVATIRESDLENKNDFSQANFALEYAITDDLKFKTSVGATTTNLRRAYYYSKNIGGGSTSNGKGGISSQTTRNLINENILSYNKSIGLHTFTVLGGVTTQQALIEAFSTQNTNFSLEDLRFNNLSVGTSPSIPSSSKENWAVASGLARINYGYDNRYLVTASIRADGSSRFATGNKWGYFPALALAWRLNKESFLQDVSAIYNLKLRLGYGITGNQEVPRYQSLSSLGIEYYGFGLDNGILSTGVGTERVANPNLTWETTTQYNIGLDLGLFSNRISTTVDYYIKKTKDMLLAVDLIPSAGISLPALQNAGSLENRGIEVILNTVNVKLDDFSWTSSFNISVNQNKILNLGTYDQIFFDVAGGNHQTVNEIILTPGQSIGSFYGYETAGILGEDSNGDPLALPEGQINLLGPGGRIYVDQNGDGVLNEDDRVVLGNGLPKHFGGFTNNFSFRGFDLNVFFDWSYGNDIYNANRMYFEELHNDYNRSTAILDSWTPENQNTEVAQIGKGESVSLIDRYIEDASFLRLKNVTLAYNFNERVLSRLPFSSLRMYVSGQNLWISTNYTGTNPQASVNSSPVAQGIDWGAYPLSRIYTVGLNVTF